MTNGQYYFIIDTMEAINSPEFNSSNLGRELTNKFRELMRHPKTDVDQEQSGDLEFDVISFETAYYQEDTGLVAYISTPETGSRQLPSTDLSRYHATLMIPHGNMVEEGFEPIFKVKKLRLA